MNNDYEDPPIGTRQARVSTWVAILITLVVIGGIIWFAARNWTPDESLHEDPSAWVAPAVAPGSPRAA